MVGEYFKTELIMIIGAFNYHRVDDNTIASTFINNMLGSGELSRSRAVSSDIVTDFTGTFEDVWFEKNNKEFKSDLTISKENLHYHLVWKSKSSDHIIFKGVGFTQDGKLVGYYFEDNMVNLT